MINSHVRPKRTKAMDMHFEWLLDREQQGQFNIYWKPGKTNLADYFTKQMDAILSNKSPKQTSKKTVTSNDSVAEPRVERRKNNAQALLQKEMSLPTVIAEKSAPAPRVALATPDTSVGGGSTTRSRYYQALADLNHIRQTHRQCQLREMIKRPIRHRQPADTMELAQAILDDEAHNTNDFACEIFDEKSGKLLKYRQLLAHPKYHKIWMHSSANEF